MTKIRKNINEINDNLFEDIDRVIEILNENYGYDVKCFFDITAGQCLLIEEYIKSNYKDLCKEFGI